mgnify:CR=1 FL=1
MPIPLPLRGIDVTLARITLQNVNATTGALTDMAPSIIGTITTKLDGASVRMRGATEEISAITSPYENNVLIQVGYEIVLREILDRVASALPTTGPVLAKLANLMNNPAGVANAISAYAKIELTRGSNTWTVYGVYQSYDEGPYVKGRNSGEMVLGAIDNGTSSLVYA